MRIYLYESHTGGLYLSMRDDLDDICSQCGGSDLKLNGYDIDEYDDWGDDIIDAVCDLLCKVISQDYPVDVFDDLISGLKNIINEISLIDKTVNKTALLKAVKDGEESVVLYLMSFVNSIKKRNTE